MMRSTPFVALKTVLCMRLSVLFGIVMHMSLLGQDVFNTAHENSNSHQKTPVSKPKALQFKGNDGPYIINDTLYRVDVKQQFTKTSVFNPNAIAVSTDDAVPNTFHLALQTTLHIPKTVYKMPDTLVVLSDIEGNFNTFSGFLLANHIIDSTYNWTFNKGHLVLLGDFVDRGKNVTQVLWLIYKLEQQAKTQGGQVHFILGNHEILNFNGNHKYNRKKYIEVAKRISGKNTAEEALKFLYSDASILGQWLATKNVIERIGDYIFVHAGLSPELLNYHLSLETINTLVRQHYSSQEHIKHRTLQFLYSTKGPFWYRGLVQNRSNYKKITPTALDELLNFYTSKHIVIGHTPVHDISSDFEGRVIRLDVAHGLSAFSGKTKGLLIENGNVFSMDDLGLRKNFD